MARARQDLTGQKFGKLTVIGPADDYIYQNGQHMAMWNCVCDCGNKITTYDNALKSGKAKSCGCIRKENLVGQKFGRLTVIKQVDKPKTRKNQARYWLCQCVCGQEIIVSTDDLKSGHTQSCGCLQKEQAAQRFAEQNRKSAGKGKKNKRTKFYLEDNYAYGFTSNTNKKFFIDLEDVEFASQYTWFENDNGYIVSRINNKIVRLHRQLMNCPNNLDIDHKKHNKQDNRKSELREVTRSQNSMNRNSKGVTKLKNGKYRAYIGVNNERIYLGDFINFDDALKARKEAEDEYFGEYSYNNSMNDNFMEDVL